MAYVLKRSSKIVEDVQIGDETITVRLDADSIVRDFTKKYNALVDAESRLKAFDATKEDPTAAQNMYGEAVVALLRLVFGDENAEKILGFYESNYLEMSVEVFPFITGVIYPQIQKSLAEQKQAAEQRFKQKE